MKLEILLNNRNREILNGIISNISDLINYKGLELCGVLSTERILSKKFGVSRSDIRESIQKLEQYGLYRLSTPGLKPLYLYCNNI